MIINVAEELNKARKGGYAVPAFNTNNLEVTKAICTAAKEFNSFILIQTTPSAIEYAGLRQIFDIVSDEIKDSGVMAAIHLDHGKDFNIIKKAIEAGYKSVMFDGSKLPLNENMHLTERLVEYAHRYGVAVEAEVGVISHEEGGRVSGNSRMSAPKEVKEFVDYTGVDSIAVSVGNEHGAPKDEKIDLKLLREIAHEVPIPLVMHGASGLSDGDIREAISLGISKINIDTNIRKAFLHEIEESKSDDFREVLTDGMEEVGKVVAHYIRLFSNNI